jgi:hypothetical protein
VVKKTAVVDQDGFFGRSERKEELMRGEYGRPNTAWDFHKRNFKIMLIIPRDAYFDTKDEPWYERPFVVCNTIHKKQRAFRFRTCSISKDRKDSTLIPLSPRTAQDL